MTHPPDGSATTRPSDQGASEGPKTPAASVFTFPNRILFGGGARGLLAGELSRLGINRPFVVTDPGIVAVGLLEEVIGPLEKPMVVFSEIQANPTEEDVLIGLDRYRGESCDGLVAVGGGSPIDAAKAIRLLVTHSGRLADYDLTRGGQDRIRAEMPPMVAIPTTAGTGSEAGRGALIQLPPDGPQDGRSFPAPLAEHGDLRPRPDARALAGLDRGDGYGCVQPLRGELSVHHVSPDLRRNRRGRVEVDFSKGWRRRSVTVPTSSRATP